MKISRAWGQGLLSLLLGMFVGYIVLFQESDSSLFASVLGDAHEVENLIQADVSFSFVEDEVIMRLHRDVSSMKKITVVAYDPYQILADLAFSSRERAIVGEGWEWSIAIDSFADGSLILAESQDNDRSGFTIGDVLIYDETGESYALSVEVK